MANMAAPVKQARVETAAEKLAWRAIREEMKRQRCTRPEQKFLIPGYLTKIEGDPENPGKGLMVDNSKYNKDKPLREVVNVTCVTTLPSCDAISFRKQVGHSFYDGYRRGSQERGPLHMRGGMWHIHHAVTGGEVPTELVNGKVGYDTDDYCGKQHPILLRFEFKGMVEEGQDYYGTRGNLNLKLDGFEPDPNAVGGGELPDDNDDWLGDDTDTSISSPIDELDELPL